MKKYIRSFLLFINLWIVFTIVKLFQIFAFLFVWYNKKYRIKKSILYLDPFPYERAAGQKYRVVEWMKMFSEEGYITCLYTIQKNYKKYFEMLNSKREYFFIFSMWKRMIQVIASCKYETVIVRRELLQFNDYGNLFMDKFLLKIHPNVILDFDDDLAEAKNEPRKITTIYGMLMLENGKKFTQTLQLYKRFIVVSHYLKEHVQKINRQIKEEAICVIPTCVNYIIHEPKVYTTSKEVVTFGWIGGTTNLKYLEEIMPDLIIVSKKYAIELLVIGGKDFEYKTPFDIINLSWSFENEIEYLKKIDVGLMPLPLNKKTKGKGGFKLIQYMGLGIVSVGSAITINKEIIKEGEDGFLVDVNVKWAEVLDRVLKQKEKFALIGNKARQKINAKYSFNANFKTYQNFIYRA